MRRSVLRRQDGPPRRTAPGGREPAQGVHRHRRGVPAALGAGGPGRGGRRRAGRARCRGRARRDRSGRRRHPGRTGRPGPRRGPGRADRRRVRGAELALLRDQRPDRGAQLGHWRGLRHGQLRRDLRHLPRGVRAGPGAQRGPRRAGPACSTRARWPTGCGRARTTATCRWPSASSS